MSGAIGPGDWVECVDASPPTPDSWASDVGASLTAGRLYLVVRTGECRSKKYGLSAGVAMSAPETHYPVLGEDYDMWPVERFRPVYRPKSEIIQSLLQPAPELEPA